MLSNPEFLKAQLVNNPIMQELIKKNPEMEEVFSDPETLKQLAEMMADPVKMDEMLRQQDQMMGNLQNVPGGMEFM